MSLRARLLNSGLPLKAILSLSNRECFLELNPPLREGREGDLLPKTSSQADTPPASPQGEVLSLIAVWNPFARAIRDGVDLNELLHADPDAGNAKLDAYVEETRGELRDAVSRGAEGICYLLEGARAGCCSPMQYGGYYLERDRELLQAVNGQTLTVLNVIGGEDVFLDFVSDLPADIFAWDSAASGFDSAYVRGLRDGVQASADPGSEVHLIIEISIQISNSPAEAYV